MKKFLSCVLCIFLCGSALAQVDSRLNSNNPPFPDVQILEIQLDNVTLNTAATPSLIYSFPYTDGEKSGVREFAIGANNQTTELFGRRYIGPFTLSEEVSTQNNQTARTMQMESAAAGETVYISNPAYTSV